jgi:thioesterase domain-containing protein/acyl carrier protein
MFAELTGAAQVGIADDFFDIGGHSLLALQLLSRIEAAFGRRIRLSAMSEALTVENLTRLLASDEMDRADLSRVVRFYPESRNARIFGINSAGAYHHLGRLLGADVPLTCLQLFDPSVPRHEMPDTLERVAADYVQLIRQQQPGGPYRLFGWSAGAILAFEVAQQLVAAGETVSYLAIVDATAPTGPGRVAQLRRITQFYHHHMVKMLEGKKTVKVFLSERWAQSGLISRLRNASRRSAAAPMNPPPTDADYEGWLAVDYLGALTRDYPVKSFHGRIHLIRARDEPRVLFAGDLLGWDRVAERGVDLSFIDGDHFSIFRPPGVMGMAKAIAATLGSAS